VPLYVVYFEPEEDGAPHNKGPARAFAGYKLKPGLHLVDSELTQSRLYHAIKRKLSEDAALFVGALDDAPKFKKVNAGALKWLRGR
jgi:hypothetical protein